MQGESPRSNLSRYGGAAEILWKMCVRVVQGMVGLSLPKLWAFRSFVFVACLCPFSFLGPLQIGNRRRRNGKKAMLFRLSPPAAIIGSGRCQPVFIHESTPKTIIVAKVGAAAPLPLRGGARGGVCISFTRRMLETPPLPLPLRGGERLRIVFGLFFSGEGFSKCTHSLVAIK